MAGTGGCSRKLFPHKIALTYGLDYHEPERAFAEEIRPRLAAPFRDLSEQDLLACGVFLVARKPGN